MQDGEIERRRFPAGRYVEPDDFDRAAVAQSIEVIAGLPERVWALAARISGRELENRYRPGGWSARQVIHHMADSHVNAYIRFKWALTEDRPLIKAYNEERWAALEDSRGSVEPALGLLAGLHARWTALLRVMDEAQFRRSFLHPETGKEWRLFESLALYDWHGRHHLAHVEMALTDPAPDVST